MKRLHGSIIALLILISLSFVVLTIKPNPTGLAVYEGQDNPKYQNITKKWNFSNQEEYTYNNSEIILEGDQASLKQIITNTTWYEITHKDYNLVYALYNPEDKTNSVDEEDGNSLS